jgi:hypothetical protein
LGEGVFVAVGILARRDLGKLALGGAVRRHIVAHDLGEEMGKDVDLAFALAGMREVTQHLADEGAIHLALVIAHLLEPDREADVTEPHLHLADRAQHRLAAGGAGVLHRFDGFGAEPRDHCYETGKKALLIEREVAGGTDRGDVDRLRFGADLGAGLVDRIGHDLRHRHVEQFSEFGLVVCGDIDLFHVTSSGVLCLAELRLRRRFIEFEAPFS